MAVRVISVSGGSRVTTGGKTYTSKGVTSSNSSSKSSSSGSSSNNSIAKRTAELQAQGIDRGNASKIANAESKGQTLTNISVSLANQIKSSGASSKAIRQSEVESLSKFTPTPSKASTRRVVTGIKQPRTNLKDFLLQIV